VVKIPFVRGVDITWVEDQYTMGRRVDIPFVGESIYHGKGSILPWVE
jgi:hypothetical protein